MEAHTAGSMFSLIGGLVLGTLKIHREGPENDIVISLEVELSLGRSRAVASLPPPAADTAIFACSDRPEL